jgi:hypothetical protein
VRAVRASALSVGMFLSGCGDPASDAVQAPEPIQVVRGAAGPEPQPATRAGSCSDLGIANVVGQRYTAAIAEQARLSSKAATLRLVNEGEAVDLSRDGDRLTLKVNANNTITHAGCG